MASHHDITNATRQIFEALDLDNSKTVSSSYLIQFLKNNGLHEDDKRLKLFFEVLDSFGAKENDKGLTLQQFCDAIASCSTLIHKCINGDLVVPDFKTLTSILYFLNIL